MSTVYNIFLRNLDPIAAIQDYAGDIYNRNFDEEAHGTLKGLLGREYEAVVNR